MLRGGIMPYYINVFRDNRILDEPSRHAWLNIRLFVIITSNNVASSTFSWYALLRTIC